MAGGALLGGDTEEVEEQAAGGAPRPGELCVLELGREGNAKP